MLPTLLIIAIIFLMAGLVFKVSFGIIKLCLGLVGVILVLVLLPVGLALIIPFGILLILVGFLKLIF